MTEQGQKGGAMPVRAGLGALDSMEARIAGLLQAKEPVVLVTIMRSAGSAPRHAGTRALQTRQGFEGTVGGGILEAQSMEAARDCLAAGRSMRTAFSLDNAAAADGCMVCGGHMEIVCEFLLPEQAEAFAAADAAIRQGCSGAWQVRLVEAQGTLEPVRRLLLGDGARALLAQGQNRPCLMTDGADGVQCYVEPLQALPVLFLCGGGHVSLEVARLAHHCGFVVEVADDREEFANPARFPMARRCHVLPGFQGLAQCGMEQGHFVAIMTRGHAFDREVLEQALACRPRYLGMIGSKNKREQVYTALRAKGVSDADLAQVCCPIGLSIFAETPEQIAVSVVAEMLAVRAGTLPRLRPER